MILASAIGSIISPFANLFGWLLAAYFSFSHNYGIAIVLLTLTVMIVVFPLTRRGTRSMMRMQLLQPELLKIRNRYKAQPGQTAEEKQANRQTLNDEMMALYRENNVSPTGGCLPMFLQFPIFIVLYDVIRGMTRTTGKPPHLRSFPEYISSKTALYHALLHSHGVLNAFGLNLADSVRSHQSSWVHVIPYVVVILVAVALQYVSIWQITNRNPAAAQANPQMQAAQKFMPLIFVFFYIVLPAGVGVYFIVSSAFRVVQQEWMYKHDPMITETIAELHKRRAAAPVDTSAQPKPKGFRAKLQALAEQSAANTEPSPAAKAKAVPSNGQGRTPRPGPRRPAGTGAGNGARRNPASGASRNGGGRPVNQQRPGGAQANGGGGQKPAPNRSQAKRPRKPR
jgi:YidC/Oxa1 family membrane protein insertase